MGDAVIEERLQAALRRVLRLPDLVVHETTQAHDVPGWDSLSHVEVLLAVQQEYGVRFRPTEVIRLKSVGDLQALVRAKTQR